MHGPGQHLPRGPAGGHELASLRRADREKRLEVASAQCLLNLGVEFCRPRVEMTSGSPTSADAAARMTSRPTRHADLPITAPSRAASWRACYPSQPQVHCK